MATTKLENLMTELHERFGEVEPSPQQQQLLEDLQQRIHNVSAGGAAEPTPLDTIEVMIESLGEKHPNVTALLRELLDTLKNIGV
ncbi:DUF4404 family protein [Saccharophagus sp. K07]|uniref:DUF4404 family protein n=1 Tax=Saccharophagus sp. K07 TaxID=2283636 RepID=UPI001652AE2F|nr:DUF4404 family protein [Saccharophagus sp. K07]MBC6904572.1 DUF4404 family protein [Saccharophagus sp. K07]